MAETLTVEEAAATYVAAMRNVLPAGPGVCTTCRTFVDPRYEQCYQCGMCWAPSLDVVVPITYSPALGQMHTALRGYKDGTARERAFVPPRIAAIIWKFLERHELCVARAVGLTAFDLVTTVPSSSAQRDEHSAFRTLAGWCGPVEGRFDRLLEPTGDAQGRAFDASRYRVTRKLSGENVLLLDDTWTTGGHAQSAAFTLKSHGAGRVGLVVVGRHLNPEWKPENEGSTCGELYDALPKVFDWDRCTVHT